MTMISATCSRRCALFWRRRRETRAKSASRRRDNASFARRRRMTVAAEWESFYVIVGSSAAALTGLQFVVVALSADSEGLSTGSDAFATPTVVHFCATLLIAAILCVPRQTPASLA